jgi:very-short-patch-repair endonuclease
LAGVRTASLDDMDSTDDAPIRGEIRLAELRRVNHGLGVFKRDGLTPSEELRRDLTAYLLVLPPGAVFTHITGAWLLGWQLPKLPDQVPVFAAVAGDGNRPRRQGLVCSRLVGERKPTMRFGLPVDSAEEILLRLARDMSLLDLLILLESALALGHVDRKRMDLLLESRRPGVRMLREAWRRATGHSESAGETLLQQFHKVLAIPFVPQVEMFDDSGTFIGRVDLLVSGTRFIHEYDGAHHRSMAQQRADLRRLRAINDAAYLRRGFTLDDLLNHAATVMHEIDRQLGRPHDVRRLARWRRLVENSLYSEAGRERILNRWRRVHGIVDWRSSA